MEVEIFNWFILLLLGFVSCDIKWQSSLTQYWWIGVRQSFLNRVIEPQWIDYNNQIKKIWKWNVYVQTRNLRLCVKVWKYDSVTQRILVEGLEVLIEPLTLQFLLVCKYLQILVQWLVSNCCVFRLANEGFARCMLVKIIFFGILTYLVCVIAFSIFSIYANQ